ncbi:hypothetical protein [Arthrobacter sp. R-11]|uniref:hypothetical protein n=1 Tax=Arthrobacter sp. R-11 TaxID=3404053 RepID=UPI003CF30E84
MIRNDATDLLPRNLYFDAVDRQMYTEGYASKIIPTEQGRRHKLLQNLIKDAEQMIHAARAAYHFDRPGNIELVLPQIADTLDDLTKHVRNFIADVETSADRYRRVNASIYIGDEAESTPGADVGPEPDPDTEESILAAAAKAAAPKPGPGVVHVAVFNPGMSAAEQLEAIDRKITRKAARR